MNEVSASVFEPMAEPAQPGRQLAAAREQCGFTVADVARQLKLSPSQVEAIEANDNQHLPDAVFVRGFIRNYARLVKLDPAPLLADAARQSQPATLPDAKLRNAIQTPFPTGHELKWRKYVIGALLVVALLVMYEFYRDDVTEVTVKSRPVVPQQSELVAPDKIAAAGSLPQPAAFGESAKLVGTTAAAQASTDTGDRSEPPSTPIVEQKSEEHLLKLRFDRESWVEIRDRHGRRISSQLNVAGTELAVSGLPPLSLVVGNAAGVRLTHNDQPVDLAPHIKIDVARLTLE